MFAFPSDQFAEAQKAHFANLFALTNTAFDGFQKLAELNLQAAKSSLAESQGNIEAALSGGDLKDVFNAQGRFAQPAADKALAYARHVYEIASGTQAEFAKAVEAQYEQHNRSVQTFVDTFVKNAPAGSEALTALLQQTVAAANNTYESVQKATKQAAETVKSNFEASTAVASGAAQQASRRTAKQ
ncbi:TIGR01841 family phasin [Cupriavidus basilensis]|uniref:TIGR01841 family phasin n=1 Tax=Cupriavidus TaxID=106589 RepID=UPI0023E80739|nr:TIGR01841 family phasin [Cupriavidus basilensis]MDF3888583.1 TIGR01841 family phasin [Cupriavidus basilensis]